MRFLLTTCCFAIVGGAAFAYSPTPAPDKAAKKTQSVDPNANESASHRDARMRWWRQARFGMFIHWGLYAELAGTWNGKQTGGAGEWIMHDLKIPVADYIKTANDFNPVKFNADDWVAIAKASGMKYIVMTAKHHEGFAMFHSKTDPYNIYDATSFKRDPIAEMAAACKKQGIKFGVYYSQAQDWRHPGGAAYGGHWDPAQDGDLHAYVKNIAAPQVQELLTRYHPAVLWWDTAVDMSPQDIKELTAGFAADRELIANNRLGNGVPGDSETPEQTIPATGFPGKDWETCMTINDTWGYKSFDTDFKSLPTLLHNLIDIASKGGNYLLNVGPDPSGLIPAPEVERIQAMGEWLRKNGESIYATTASPYRKLPFNGRATVKGSKLFLNVFEWPTTPLMVSGLATTVKGARVLATGQSLKVTKAANGDLTIEKPTQLDPISTTIELNLASAPVVTEPEARISLHLNAIQKLDAESAATMGGTLQLQGSGADTNIGYWTNAKDSVEWKVDADVTSRCKVSLELSCAPGSEGSTFEIDVDNVRTIEGTVPKTTSWNDFTTIDLDGSLQLTAGKHTIKIVPVTKPGLAVMNLKSMTLTPP